MPVCPMLKFRNQVGELFPDDGLEVLGKVRDEVGGPGGVVSKQDPGGREAGDEVPDDLAALDVVTAQGGQRRRSGQGM